MKLVATSIVALFAAVAFANPAASTSSTATTPAGSTATATAPADTSATATTPAAKDMKSGKDMKAAGMKEDCTKMTGEAKTKCETSAKSHK